MVWSNAAMPLLPSTKLQEVKGPLLSSLKSSQVSQNTTIKSRTDVKEPGKKSKVLSQKIVLKASNNFYRGNYTAYQICCIQVHPSYN